MIAAVTARAFDTAGELAPAGVEVRLLPDWQDRETIEELPRLERLRVVQSLSAGTDWIEARVPAWATLCNATGARDASVAEWVVGALLGDAYGQPTAARARRWSDAKPRELQGATVLIVGFGSIGRADAVVVLAPLTLETRGMIDAALLARMRDGALVLNAGRGAVVDPEPLPHDDPLLDVALTITPHNAGDTPAADERAVRFGAEQLARFARGEPLRNVVRAAA